MPILDGQAAPPLLGAIGVAAQTHDGAAEAVRQKLRFEMFTSLAAAEPIWRDLETRAVLTPYQRFDWVSALLDARQTPPRLAIVVVYELDRPVALLPLEVISRLAFRCVRMVGWDIGNGDWMAVEPGFASQCDQQTVDLIMRQIAQLTRSDLLVLHSQPAVWNGLANPLLPHIKHQPSPDHLYMAPLDGERLDAKRLRNLRRGRRRLEEAMGPVRLLRADTPDAIATVHETFLRQRDVRFRQMGVDNVFAEPEFQRFFRLAAERSLGSAQPALVFHALMAGEEMVATSIGSLGGSHYSQYINSTTEGPAAKYSLMGMLMLQLAEELQAAGVTSLDMGLGDFDYKLDWTDQHEAFDAVIPLTTAGDLGGAVLLALRALKRSIKQTPRLWQLAKRARMAINGLRRPRG